MMWAVLFYMLPLAIVVVANLGVRGRHWRFLAYLLLGLLNVTTLFLGLTFLAAPHAARIRTEALTPSVPTIGAGGLGLTCTVAAILGSVFQLPRSRCWLAGYLPIDPSSPVHATALILLVYLTTASVGLLLTSKELVRASIQAPALEPGTLVLGQTLLLLLAISGVGLGIRRNTRQTLERLGLSTPTRWHLLFAAIVIVAFLALDYLTSSIWHQFWPASHREVQASTRQLFARFSSLSGALVMAVSAGIGEETLFRGALQPRLRILLTAAVFALGHVQYGFSPAIVEIFVIGLVLSWLRDRANTTTCIVVHAGYNFCEALLMPYFP
jgi:membrane protease YdiL (CAAX protease family)